MAANASSHFSTRDVVSVLHNNRWLLQDLCRLSCRQAWVGKSPLPRPPINAFGLQIIETFQSKPTNGGSSTREQKRTTRMLSLPIGLIKFVRLLLSKQETSLPENASSIRRNLWLWQAKSFIHTKTFGITYPSRYCFGRIHLSSSSTVVKILRPSSKTKRTQVTFILSAGTLHMEKT